MPSSTSNSDADYPAAGLRFSTRGWLAILVGLLVVAVAGDRFIAAGCEQVLLQSRFRFSRVYAAAPGVDVLIFGDSRAVNTFHAPEMGKACGMSVLNLGYNGSSTDIAAVLLEDYLARHEPPKLVVVEVSSLLQGNELLKSLKMYAGVSPGLSRALAEYAPAVSTATRVTHLYRFNSEMFLRAFYYLGQDDQAWINAYTMGPALLAAATSLVDEPLPMEAPARRNLDALVSIRRRCEAEGVAVLLVLGPYMPLYRQRLTGVEEWLAGVAANVGLPVNDLSTAIDDLDCYADNLHMNARGAAALLPAVVRLVREALQRPAHGE